MANALQLRRGTTTQHSTFTGLAGEVTVDTTKDTVVVHDGSTAGGIPLATEAQNNAKLPLSGGTMTGAITFASGQSFDGRDVSADGAKLDGIESGATADQTAAEIRSLVESASNSNVFTDADHTKLNGIESGATADQSASEILTAIKTVDGSGSGLDADTVDGIQGSSIVQTSDSRLTNSRQCNNSFDNTTTARNNLGLGTGNSVSFNSVTVNGATVNGQLDIEEVHEYVNHTSSTSGAITFDTQTQGIIYYTSNQTANRSVNFTNVNSTLSTNQSVTCTLLMSQGSTAYYISAVSVDGSVKTVKYQGGSAPTGGNANSVDVYTFTIVKDGSSNISVFGSQTQYA